MKSPISFARLIFLVIVCPFIAVFLATIIAPSISCWIHGTQTENAVRKAIQPAAAKDQYALETNLAINGRTNWSDLTPYLKAGGGLAPNLPSSEKNTVTTVAVAAKPYPTGAPPISFTNLPAGYFIQIMCVADKNIFPYEYYDCDVRRDHMEIMPSVNRKLRFDLSQSRVLTQKDLLFLEDFLAACRKGAKQSTNGWKRVSFHIYTDSLSGPSETYFLDISSNVFLNSFIQTREPKP